MAFLRCPCDSACLYNLSARAATRVVGANRNGLQLWSFDQTQRNTHIMEPFLQFAVHKAPFRENTATNLC
jgi:hypothetical protein